MEAQGVALQGEKCWEEGLEKWGEDRVWRTSKLVLQVIEIH